MVTDHETSCSSRALGPAQKGVVGMKDVVRKFLWLCETVVDPCAGTSTPADACMFLSRHHWFLRCEIDNFCFIEPVLGAVELFAVQVLNEKWDIVGETDVQAAANVLVSAIDSIGARRKKLF